MHLVRKRTDLPFNWIVVLFAIFIVSCGFTHWIEVWTVWNPDYWLSGNVKVVTAIASVLTATALVRLVPGILAIPTVAQLTAAKNALEVEVASRRRAEQALLLERAELERRVAARTEELRRATEAAHAAAEEANKLKDRFLAKVSHELRTPLQSTLTWAQVLQHSALDPARASLACDRIMHNVRSQARLIDDLLDISRILSGKLNLGSTQVDAAAVINKAAEVVRTGSSSRGVSIDVEGDNSADLTMTTDAVRLEQAVWNLINNAVQASHEGGRVRVRYHADGSMLRVEVQDWGRGIDPADLPLIFEPFREAQRDGNAHRGLGLGLAITRNIVDLVGGELKAFSAGVGRGATFTLQIPMRSAAPPTQVMRDSAVDEAQRARLKSLRVLYVEDEKDIAEGGVLALSTFGAHIDVCLSFDEARKRILAGGFDVLLSDLNLGHGHTALELIDVLQDSPHGRTIPALVLSAYGSAEDREASLRAGFTTHIVKPGSAEEVARAIADAVRES